MKFLGKTVFILSLSSLIFSCKQKESDPNPLKTSHELVFEYSAINKVDISNYRAPIKLDFSGKEAGTPVDSFSCRFFINDSLIYKGYNLGQTVEFTKGGTYKLKLNGYFDGEVKEVTKSITILPPYKSVDVTKVTYSKLYLIGIYEYLNPYIILINSQKDTIYNGINEYKPQIKEASMPISYNVNYNINLEGNPNNYVRLSLEDKKPSPWKQESTTISYAYILPYTLGCDYTKNPYPEVVDLAPNSWGIANDSLKVYLKWNE